MGEQSICKLPSVSWIFKKPTLEQAAGRGCSEEDEIASVCTASKVSNLPLSPACTGRALDQRAQIFPCSKVYLNLVLCLILSTNIYYLFWSYNIVSSYNEDNNCYFRGHPQTRLQFLYNKFSFMTPEQPNAHLYIYALPATLTPPRTISWVECTPAKQSSQMWDLKAVGTTAQRKVFLSICSCSMSFFSLWPSTPHQ